MRPLYVIFIIILFFSCKEENRKIPVQESEGEAIDVAYAKGFTITRYDGYKILTINDPWPDADVTYRYLLVEDEEKLPLNLRYEQKIKIPVEKIVVTSTTHIPSLEALDSEESLVGFPGLDYISSKRTRKLISDGKITELGKNEAINTEVLISLEPELVVGFAVNGNNKTYATIQRSGIPVIFNGDWTEDSPLGKAEWIKFFGALFNKSDEAGEYFENVVQEYEKARKLARTSSEKPTVLSGSMYKDQWFVPYGNSWNATFIEDANASYIYKDTRGSGSIALAFETVLSDAQDVDFWVSPGQFKSFEQLMESSTHYSQFKAVRQQNVYTYSNSTGETGGVIFYELAPTRPDIVLKDLISIFHPRLLPNYEPVFFKPLD